ncbi:MAG: hypothetical protein AB1668_02305 [Nanoarchaeota archaeon]
MRDFEKDFEKIIQELSPIATLEGEARNKALLELEQRKTERRIQWLKDKYPHFHASNLQEVYIVFYQEYFQLSPDDGNIITLSDTELITRWRNPCPVLKACVRLHLETSEICQKVYEQPCQALLSRLNQHLSFSRDYTLIRPYVDFCEEKIKLNI